MTEVDGSHDTQYAEMTKAKKRKGGDIAGVFVHAGAGFHSVQNEQVHLEACAKAAQAGMAILRVGDSALDAVEAAIRVLEDNEITNAGYGSNLAIDGTVECDATIVDQYGRSGAVGAMGHVAHPIHVARYVLEGSTRRLSLRRVPPNLLVGQGAVEYAFDSGIPTMPNDYLVSRSARERWKRWTRDLEQANEKAREYEASMVNDETKREWATVRPDLVKTPTSEKRFAPLVNESQPYSPTLSPAPVTPVSGREDFFGYHPAHTPSRLRPNGHELCQPGSCELQMPGMCAVNLLSTPRSGRESRQDGSAEITIPDWTDSPNCIDPFPPILPETAGHIETEMPARAPSNQSSRDGSDDTLSLENLDISAKTSSTDAPLDSDDETSIDAPTPVAVDDNITDTVGAIAIDSFGNIAAASSSGGIGMKHKGRTGPAALVGIGTAVHPIHHGDKSKKCVGVVTSGTGEHMATTMAAGTCANRLYWGTKTSSSGETVVTDDEDAIQSFVRDDFMGHPSVKHSNTTAAIGVMSVKKTADGVWFNFAHNTDSFALASMTSEDAEAQVVMSRIPNKNNRVASGGRSCSWRPSKSDGKDSKRRKRTDLIKRKDRGDDKKASLETTSTGAAASADAAGGSENDPIIL